MSKGKGIALLLLVLLVAGLTYIKIKNVKEAKLKEMPKGGGKGGPQQAVRVTGFIAEYTKLSNDLSANGSIVAGDEIQLQPEISGRITYLNIKEGSFVGKGTVLAKINDIDLQAQLKKLQAQLQIAKSTEQRLSQLIKISGISQQEYDVAVNNVNNANADIETRSCADR